jgi:hypothetical protein
MPAAVTAAWSCSIAAVDAAERADALPLRRTCRERESFDPDPVSWIERSAGNHIVRSKVRPGMKTSGARSSLVPGIRSPVSSPKRSGVSKPVIFTCKPFVTLFRYNVT